MRMPLETAVGCGTLIFAPFYFLIQIGQGSSALSIGFSGAATAISFGCHILFVAVATIVALERSKIARLLLTCALVSQLFLLLNEAFNGIPVALDSIPAKLIKIQSLAIFALWMQPSNRWFDQGSAQVG